MLNFVNPIFAWLALAAAIPLVIHLLNRRRYLVTKWAAMEFLLKALQKNRRRLQMESLILLLLRMFIIVALAFALAKPYFKGTLLNAKEPDTHLIIALDNSYSMGYLTHPPLADNLLGDGRQVARKMAASLRPGKGDHLSLITISDKPEILSGESSFQMEITQSKIMSLEVSNYATDMSKALTLSKEIFNKSTSSRKVLCLITDNQKNAWDRLISDSASAIKDDQPVSRTLASDFEVRVIQVGEGAEDNNYVSRIYTDSRIITAKRPVTFFAEVKNSQTRLAEKPESFINLTAKFYVNDHQYASRTAKLAQNNSIVVPFAYTFSDPGEYWIKIEIDSDRLTIDDSRLFAVAVRESVPGLIINGKPSSEPSEDEVTYLRYALLPAIADKNTFNIGGDSAPVSPYSLDIKTSLQLANEELQADKYNFIIAANVEYFPEDKVRTLEQWVRAGGGLMIFLGEKVDRNHYNETLYKKGQGLLPFQLGEIKGDSAHNQIIRFGDIDFTHPALAFFSSIKERFRTLSIFQYYELLEAPEPQDGSRILARLANSAKSPLIVEKSFGRGKVIVVATTAGTSWNLMPVRPMYVMLVDRMVMYLSTPQGEDGMNTANLQVGEPINMPLNQSQSSANYALKLPKGGSVSLTPMQARFEGKSSESGAETKPGNNQVDEIADKQYRLLYENTGDTGLYSLTSREENKYFAVNPNSREGDLRRITAEELKQIMPDAQISFGAGDNGIDMARENTSASNKNNTSRLWQYLLYILLVFVVLEMLLAWRFGRR